ncbi:sigma-70 family RNA polymerase sigma factor [Methylobacillus flagellatus]|uniref:sigma-70 family RNA polymerase sigma factor n=1 Tax=Methylobacillus flagellatus TaxID=405 RepID=UPI0010F882F6|nr:sigma-70 family RNA polymerase sigma factor [Methylobacillus flagellatus]
MTTYNTLQHAEFHDFYQLHNNWLYSWLSRKLGSRFDAADLAQDTFTSIWSSTTRFSISDIREPRAYLTTVAQRILINFQKHQSLERAYLEALSHLPEAATLSTEERAILLETLQQIDTMLDGLDAKVRQAFLLSQMEGLGYAEIAVQLKVSERTIKRYMAEALTQCLLCMD